MIKNYETKRAAIICIGTGIACIALSLLSGCGPNPFQGPAGPQGAEGVAAIGPTGLLGVAGSAGANGSNGLSVVQKVLPAGALCASNSGSLLTFAQDNADTGQFVQGDIILDTVLVCDGQTGAVGPTGASGTNGADGLTGTTGATGSQGAAGASGTVFTSVQFCPSSFVPTYPSVFPESGICYNGNLWGVYSENGGFWAELPPGQYSSDGINASCTFTIEPNCAVSN